jgi:hypothetical protein
VRAITQVGATPNRVAIIHDVLAEAGPDGVERAALESLITPSTLADDPEPGVDNAFRQSLSAGEDLGLFHLEGGLVRLVDLNGASFLAAVEARAIDQPTSVVEPDGWLAGAISWILCQDPRRPLPFGETNAVNQLREDMRGGGGPQFGMTNNSRWHMVVYWSRALGYVERMSVPEEMVVPDPTRAIARRLARLLPVGLERPLPGLLADLAVDCPVMDGGRLRREVETLTNVARQPNVASASLALVLLRLKARGALAFTSLSDGQAVFIEGLPDGRATHVTRRAVA